jgi:chaperonin cofactor prefoldin
VNTAFWYGYAQQLEDKVHDLDERVAALQEQINTRDEIIEQLEGDLYVANAALALSDARGLS